jgi:predicted  nucleic acid-binding Zn-ribbon protein
MFPPLAEFAPLPPAAQWAIVSLLSVALTLVLIYNALRRKPPLDAELVKLQSAIESLQKSVDDLTETQKAHATHASEIAELQRKVTALEQHREEDARAQRTYTRESGQRIFVKIDELSASVAQNFQSVERAIGQLEGQVKSLVMR